MVDRSATLNKIEDVKVYACGLYDVQVSQGDTVTLGEFSTGTNLLRAVLNRKDTGADVTCTVSNNVVIVSGAGTNLNCKLYVYGVKA
jgi:hypothetical protein